MLKAIKKGAVLPEFLKKADALQNVSFIFSILSFGFRSVLDVMNSGVKFSYVKGHMTWDSDTSSPIGFMKATLKMRNDSVGCSQRMLGTV